MLSKIRHAGATTTDRGYNKSDLLYVPMTLLNCFLAAWLAREAFGLNYSLLGVVFTAALLTPAFVLLGPAFRNIIAGELFGLTTCLLVLLSHGIKIAAMKSPILAMDFEALPVLLRVLSGKYLLWGVLLLCGLLIVAVACIRLRSRSLLMAAAAGLYGTAVVLSSPLWIPSVQGWLKNLVPSAQSQAFDEKVRTSDQIRLLEAQGALLYLLNDWEIMRREAGYIPSKNEISALHPPSWHIPAAPKRNIHIVLLESIWDASVLDGLDISGFDPRFQALWDAAGRPHALSPVIGGATANAEFETLCGLTSPSNSIAFLDNLTNASPCLPAVLRQLGYRTLASHPHQPGNWNRANAYARLGFEEFRPVSAFQLDDMEGPFLADSSLFRQNAELLKRDASDRPVFNYIVSLSSHWGYTRDHGKRPDRFTLSESGAQVLPLYLNASFYTTKAFMDWMQIVLAQDPDALIVVFGDHAPVLDTQPDTYERLNAEVAGKFESDAVRRKIGIARVPYMVIDGDNGPLKSRNDLPLFELPSLLGQLLKTGPLLPQVEPPSAITLRPVLGQLLAEVDGAWIQCGTLSQQKNTPACSYAWKHQIEHRLVRQDIIAGRQYFLTMSGAQSIRKPAARMNIVQEYSDCEFEVKQWGPSEARIGEAFYPTPDGQSAVWITFNKLRGAPKMAVGTLASQTVQGDKLMTATVPTADITGRAGVFRITLQCPDEAAVKVGELVVH